MRVLVLGATGSIGTAVSTELKARGYDVVALARSKSSSEKLEKLGYETILGDIRSPNKWSTIIHSVDAIVHAAVTFTDDMGDVDRRLLEELSAQAVNRTNPLRMIYTGGCWLYGATGNAIATEEEINFNPISSFAWMVDNARFLLDRPEFNTAIIHPAMVYHSEGGVFARFLEQAAVGCSIEIWGSHSVRWPLIHRDDLAVAYCSLLANDALAGHFNASSEKGVRVGEIAEHIAQTAGNELPFVERTMEDVVREHGEWAEGPTLDQQMASDKLRQQTGWSPRVTDYSKTKLNLPSMR